MIKTFTIEFTEINCGGCGVVYFIPDYLYKSLRETHKGFHCPNGCIRVFNVKSEAEKLKDQLTIERAAHDQTKADLHSKAKQLKRVACGVCPCCNRTFKNLARHMATKHKVEIKKDDPT